MKRREFIVLSGIGATSTTVLSACGNADHKLIRALVPDDEYVPGLDYWKASTCGMCPAGCGVSVRTREHKANKIEGNGTHPVNRGTLCARGQAGLQLLYNPDRIRTPLQCTGERGSGRFEEITWDDAIRSVAARLGLGSPLQAETTLQSVKLVGGGPNNSGDGMPSAVFVTEDRHGVTGLAAEHLSDLLDGRLLLVDGNSNSANLAGYQAAYGRTATPTFDIANATFLLSFGARFLETWHSPMTYSLAYGEFRKSGGKQRGQFVQVEPRMSLTGANADEWLPAAPGTEPLLALAIAQVILREGLIGNAPSPDFLLDPLDEHSPEKTGEITGIPADRVIRIARALAEAERALVVAGGEFESEPAIHFLNLLTGNVNKPGGVLLNQYGAVDPLRKLRKSVRPQWASLAWSDIVDRSKAATLLLHKTNPLFSRPDLKERLTGSPFIVSFASFLDETAEIADLILPDHTFLEAWDLRGIRTRGKRAAVSITRPVVEPEHNTRQTADVLIDLMNVVAAGRGASPSFRAAEDAVSKAIISLGATFPADPSRDSVARLLEAGVWEGELSGELVEPPRTQHAPARYLDHVRSQDSGLTLYVYQHAALGHGDYAHLPLLQELPDPMTSVMWGSWIEINPATALDLGIEEEDLVEVRTDGGALQAPALLYPGIRPDVIAMPLGQGHTSQGKYAAGRGVNPALLCSLEAVSDGMHMPVQVRKVGGKGRLVRFGAELLERIEFRR